MEVFFTHVKISPLKSFNDGNLMTDIPKSSVIMDDMTTLQKFPSVTAAILGSKYGLEVGGVMYSPAHNADTCNR